MLTWLCVSYPLPPPTRMEVQGLSILFTDVLLSLEQYLEYSRYSENINKYMDIYSDCKVIQDTVGNMVSLLLPLFLGLKNTPMIAPSFTRK